MSRDRFRSCSVKRFCPVLIIALIAAAPFYAVAGDDGPGEAPKGDPAGTSGRVICPQCQSKAAELRRVSGELESKKRELAEILRDVRNEEEYKRELTVKEKGREFLKDDPNIGKEIEELKKKLEGLPGKKERQAVLESEIRELEARKSKLGQELGECRKKCREQPGGSPAGPQESPPTGSPSSAGCPDCKSIADELDRARAELEKKKEEVRRLEADIESLSKKIMEKESELDELDGWGDFVPKSGAERTEYQRRRFELFYEIKELRDEREHKGYEILAIEDGMENISKRIKEIEECGKKCPVPGKETCPPTPFGPIKIGPQLKFGSGASNTAKDVAKGVLGGLIGGILGGGGGGGGPSGMGETADRPPLDTNPFRKMNTFTDSNTGTAICLAGKQTEKGVLIATGVEKGDGKPTIHSITLHRDDDCSIMMPDKYFLYELWANWWISVSWTRTTYVDNQAVKRESGGWSSSGSELIGRGVFAADQAGEDSVWKHFGFDRATGGAKTVGAEFQNLAKGGVVKLPDKAVVHITQPDKDPVTTVPFVFRVSQKTEGMLDFEQLPGVR